MTGGLCPDGQSICPRFQFPAHDDLGSVCLRLADMPSVWQQQSTPAGPVVTSANRTEWQRRLSAVFPSLAHMDWPLDQLIDAIEQAGVEAALELLQSDPAEASHEP